MLYTSAEDDEPLMAPFINLELLPKKFTLKLNRFIVCFKIYQKITFVEQVGNQRTADVIRKT